MWRRPALCKEVLILYSLLFFYEAAAGCVVPLNLPCKRVLFTRAKTVVVVSLQRAETPLLPASGNIVSYAQFRSFFFAF